MSGASYLKRQGIVPVRLSRSLPCLGGTLLTGITEDEVIIAIVPESFGGWTAEWDDSSNARHCTTVDEARTWLSLLQFGFTRKIADELTDKIMVRERLLAEKARATKNAGAPNQGESA